MNAEVFDIFEKRNKKRVTKTADLFIFKNLLFRIFIVKDNWEKIWFQNREVSSLTHRTGLDAIETKILKPDKAGLI